MFPRHASVFVSSLSRRGAIMKHAPHPTVDATGDPDLRFFLEHPGVNERVRPPLKNELFPGGVIAPGASVYVHIRISRDADGMPKRRARRRLCFCEGGTA
jgi:hypothetical protein